MGRAAPLPVGKKWHLFMSHSKRAGERTPALVRAVKAILEGRSYTAFFDVDNLQTITLENLKAEIEASVVLLVIVDEATFDSEWCREEVCFHRLWRERSKKHK